MSFWWIIVGCIAVAVAVLLALLIAGMMAEFEDMD